ncbi:MAG: nitroreductase family protein [Candidatus Lokiarchaeota archaeon]|nr:nitroreductase family protein [Candidatus Lokiarchaeota archaeon]
MSVIGIDKEKCSNCKLCIQECGRGYFYLGEDGQVLFNENLSTCNICGHCIAICGEDAIITKNLDDVETFPGIDSPEKIVESEKLLQLLRAKRSIRRYKNKEVPKELIEKVFEAMRYAPSASNARAWRYIILSDPDKLQKLSDEIVKVNYPYMGFQSAEQALEHLKSIGRNLFYHAPHVIVLYYRVVEKSTVMVGLRANDAGIALTYGMLEAESLGLGTCWIGMVQGAVVANKEILKILGIKGMVLGAFTLGYPAVKYRRTVPRPPLKIKGLDLI